jgi:hypothetical protein
MEILSYKEGANLVFLKGNEEMRYDFRDKGFYKTNPKSRTLRKVNNAYTFFKDVSIDDFIAGSDNPAYAEYIRLVKQAETRCKNIGTLLDRLPDHKDLEQYVLAGIKLSTPDTFTVPLSTFAKPVREFMATSRYDFASKSEDTDWTWVGSQYKRVTIVRNDGWQKAYTKKEWKNGEYVMANEQLFINLCTYINTEYHNDLEVYRLWIKTVDGYNGNLNTFSELLATYKCEYKALFDYLISCHRYEALGFNESCVFLRDYYKMCRDLNRRSYEKYPKNLRLAHDLVLRNFKNKEKYYDDVKFASLVDNTLAWSKDEYQILVPQVSADVKLEGQNLDHCVASYIDRILDGTTQIVFFRQSDDFFESYKEQVKLLDNELGVETETEFNSLNDIPSILTVEIRDGIMVQARGYKNRNPTEAEKVWLHKYAKNKGLKITSSELKLEEIEENDND